MQPSASGANAELQKLRSRVAELERRLAAPDRDPERRAASDPLRRLELAEVIEDGVAAFDENWTFTFVNTNAERILGRPAGELIDRQLWDCYPEMLGTETERQCRRVMAERTPATSEEYNPVLRRWFEGRYYPLPDGGIVALFTDVSEKRFASDALRASEARWRSLANALPQFIWVNNPDQTTIFINRFFFEYTGVPVGDFDATHWSQAIHPDDLPAIGAVRERSRTTGTEQTFEYRVRHAQDGHWRWHRGFQKPERDAEGRIVRWIGTAFDIHDHREAEERQRLAVDAGGVGLWDWDVLTDHIVWSDRVYQMHGVESNAFRGSVADFAQLIHPDDRDRVSEAIRSAIEAGQPYELEFRIVRPSGEVRWLYTRAQVLRDGGGLRMLGASLDVTESVTARQQLQAKSEQLSVLFEYASDPIFVADEQGRYIDVNSAACRLLGYTREELLQLTTIDVMAPGDEAQHEAALQNVRLGNNYRGDRYLRHKDGSRIPVEISGTRLPDGRILGFVRDIRERQRLHEATVRLATIVESSDDAILSTDLSGRILSWNAGAERMFGYSASETVGQFLSMLAPAGVDDSQSILRRIATGERVRYHESRRQTKDGRELIVSISASPVHDVHGEVIGASKIERDITDRRRAEEELRRSEQQLRFVLDHAPAFIAYLDTSYRYVRANKAYAEWLGLPVEQIRGRHIRDVFGDQYFRIAEPMLRRVQAGETVGFDAQAHRPNGDLHDFWVTYTPDVDASGRLQGFIALVQDVTERNRNQRALREREQERERLLAALPDVITRFGPDLRFRYASPAIARFTGRPPEFFTGKTHQEAGLAEDLAETLRASLRRVFDTGESDSVEFQADTPFGVRTMVGLAIPERDDTGLTQAALSVVRDISEQRQAEQDREELLEREMEARQTAELLNQVGPILAAELDGQKLVQSVAEIAAKLAGAEAGTLLPNASDATPPAPSVLDVPLMSRSGQVLGRLCLTHSQPGRFTERHQALVKGLAAQAAIALDNARLFEHARQVQDELRRSNEELRRANKDLETFAYSVSHDLQEPLRLVSISAQLLERKSGELPEQSRTFLASIHEGASRMRTLMEDLLTYTRAIRQADGIVSVVSPHKALDRVRQNLLTAMEETGATITNTELPDVRMMEVHLTQILQNLISNALKYRGAETPRVHVAAEQQDGFVTFSVTDNGIGIDPRFREQIFGLFKRLHTREAYPGSGVGLAICQRVVEQYGGRIWVEDPQSGCGSVFRFSVPGV